MIHDEAEFTGSADSLGGRAGVGTEFYRHLASILPGTLVVAVVLFMLIPRMGRFDLSPFRWGRMSAARGSAGSRTTGFSDTVELGEEGSLTEDPEEIIQFKLLKPDSDDVYPMQGKIYLRGALLDNYVRGKWDFQRSTIPAGLVKQDPRSEVVRQQISIQPLDRRELFCIWPFVTNSRDQRLTVDFNTSRLLRPRRFDTRPFELGTYALVDGRQVPLTPNFTRINRGQLLQMQADDLPTLIAEADRWIQESRLDETQVVERAKYLESQFTISDRYAYSLDGQNRSPRDDPIEDFVKTMPLGHCEYFATALALMLRSQGIPSRVVNGFVTNEYDTLGEHYRVRQRDAHSWVEAYISPEHLPEIRPFGQEYVDWQRGGWLRLDPTPSRVADTTFAALVDNVESWFEWMKSAWVRYVVEMDGVRQREAIYDPLKSLALTLKRGLIDADGWRGLWTQCANLPGLLRALLADAGWFSWVGATLLFGTLGAGYFAYRLTRWMLRLAIWLLPRNRSRAGRRSRIAFYRRLETLLARHGLRRRSGQTHREFAVAAGHHLANGQGKHAESAAILVTEAFYEVRFGNGSLDSFHVERVEQALRILEHAATGRLDRITS